MTRYILLFYFLCPISATLLAQEGGTGTLRGSIHDKGGVVPGATIEMDGTSRGTTADADGNFSFDKVLAGEQSLTIRFLGYRTITKQLTVIAGQITVVDLLIHANEFHLDQVVVTGTRTEKRLTDSPVIVNLTDSKDLDQVVAVNLAEGLKYQSGLRVETNCQTCNYTQIRMNGLQGGYSQILINSRAIFSPLTGLYGLEQIPVNMIERIEVVRGGVSALYGSSAIGGTVNVITKVPTFNSYHITNTYQSLDGEVSDNILSANATLINDRDNAGASFFFNNRKRGAFDANGDNFSELPELKDNSFGANLFYLPTEKQKLSVSLSSIFEYRYGGEMIERPAYLARQSEERTHNVLMGSIDYQVDFNEDNSSFALYYGGQNTDRQHYTGVNPDEPDDLASFFADPPYGSSEVVTHQGGFQLNNSLQRFLGGQAKLSAGAEYVYDHVFDEIDTYNYLIDQQTTNLGIFLQHDWDVLPDLNLLSGFRLDKHKLVDHTIFSPRLSLLYKIESSTQFRLGWGTGFRAPQAFDTDLHIAFAGGGVSRISLSDKLKEERSNSFTASVNYDKATEHFIAGFTLEGFYTSLNDAFYQFPLGEDQFGQRFEKRNGAGATVKGLTLGARANFDYVFEIEAGLTVQSNRFDEAVVNLVELPARREFMRTPNEYGYATLTYTPTRFWSASANVVYTGSMEIAHVGGGGTGQAVDDYFSTPTFTEVGFRIGHTFTLSAVETGLEIFGGAKNIFDAYQDDFDISKNRDSNYIYGPAAPRTLFIGLRIKSL